MGTTSIYTFDDTRSFDLADVNGDGNNDLILTNVGSRIVSVLYGKGNGSFSNPDVLLTGVIPEQLRAGDVDNNGTADLILFDREAETLTVYLGDGNGDLNEFFVAAAGTGPTGFALVDIDLDGNLDLQVTNDYGDLLTLYGNGDGTFRPYLRAGQSITLAVADLDGDGQDDFVFANQGQDRVSVQYGSQTEVLGDRSSGLLGPGSVQLADMNSDGIQDLVVANSGSNNVMVYLGQQGGTFSSPVNGSDGFFVGTNPVGFTISDVNGDGLLDILTANQGSNDVSVLFGSTLRDEQAQVTDWTMTTGQRLDLGAGSAPVAVSVVNNEGQAPSLLVANSGTNSVAMIPGTGSDGLFADTQQQSFAVGSNPAQLFIGNFDGFTGLDFVTLNAGSSNLSLVSGFGSASVTTQILSSGGIRPVAGFSGDFNSDGFSDLFVANNGDGGMSVLFGGDGGLSTFVTATSLGDFRATDVAFGGVADGRLSAYVAGAGAEAAFQIFFDLTGSQATFTDTVGLTVQTLLGFAFTLNPALVASSIRVMDQAVTTSDVVVLSQLEGSELGLGLVATLFSVVTLDGNAEDGEAADDVSTADENTVSEPMPEEVSANGDTDARHSPAASLWSDSFLGTDQSMKFLKSSALGRILAEDELADEPGILDMTEQFFEDLLRNSSLQSSANTESTTVLAARISQVFEGFSEHHENLANKGMTTLGEHVRASNPSSMSLEARKIRKLSARESVESKAASTSAARVAEEHTNAAARNEERTVNVVDRETVQLWRWLVASAASAAVVFRKLVPRPSKESCKKLRSQRFTSNREDV